MAEESLRFRVHGQEAHRTGLAPYASILYKKPGGETEKKRQSQMRAHTSRQKRKRTCGIELFTQRMDAPADVQICFEHDDVVASLLELVRGVKTGGARSHENEPHLCGSIHIINFQFLVIY